MTTNVANSWAQYVDIVSDIRTKYASRELLPGYTTRNEILFRGQPDSRHELLTTLDRTIEKPMSVRQYLKIATRVANEIESNTGTKWQIPPWGEIEQVLGKSDSWQLYLPAYNYLVYLRHHGFPSPLLDWTTSPYIAAYFALADTIPASVEKVAVYAYIEHPEGIKGGREKDPFIHVMGKNVSTHRRHFLQKALYTVATVYDPEKKEHTFVQHDEIFSSRRPREQDVIIKIEIPSNERLNMLGELEDLNINHYTLFQSEDSLIKALAIREFLLKR